MMCESGFNGGGGYTPNQVAQMTLDQIWFRLCDIKILERSSTVVVTGKKQALEMVGLADKDGKIAGLDADGNPIKARIRGKSLVRELMEKQEEEKKRLRNNKKRKRRQKRRR